MTHMAQANMKRPKPAKSSEIKKGDALTIKKGRRKITPFSTRRSLGGGWDGARDTREAQREPWVTLRA
jgi:hypothetical protein